LLALREAASVRAARRSNDAKFRDQVRFDRFVVDFSCRAAELGVESDG